MKRVQFLFRNMTETKASATIGHLYKEVWQNEFWLFGDSVDQDNLTPAELAGGSRNLLSLLGFLLFLGALNERNQTWNTNLRRSVGGFSFRSRDGDHGNTRKHQLLAWSSVRRACISSSSVMVLLYRSWFTACWTSCFVIGLRGPTVFPSFAAVRLRLMLIAFLKGNSNIC